MTRSRIIQISIIVVGLISLHLLMVMEFDLQVRSMPKEDDVIAQVKHEYAISCTQGMELADPHVKCKNLKKFIDKYEGHDVKILRGKLVSEVGR